MLPDSQYKLFNVIYNQIISALLVISNSIFLYIVITYANKRYGNVKKWTLDKNKRAKSIIIAVIRWGFTWIQGVSNFLFFSNLFFQYSNDNYEKDCPNGTNCLSCCIYRVIANSAFGFSLGCDYALMVQVLKDTLLATKLSYSKNTFTAINASIFIPMLIGGVVGLIDPRTQISTLSDDEHVHIHVCLSDRPHSREISIFGSIAGAWLTMAGFAILGLFLFKLRQV